MQLFLALIYGAAAGVVSILLHQSLPPFGVIASLVITYLSIWSIGRRYGKRSYKWGAAIGWIAIIIRGSTFGAGQELLLQADGVGSTLLLLGTLVALAAVAARS
ncbi:hypothetical protein MCEJIRE27_01097 [Candidatus Nanopelagicaceae bacterium]